MKPPALYDVNHGCQWKGKKEGKGVPNSSISEFFSKTSDRDSLTMESATHTDNECSKKVLIT